MKEQTYSRVIGYLGGRKFVFSSALMTIVCGLFAFGVLSESAFVELVQWVGVAYLGANGLGSIGGKDGREPDKQ